TSVVSDVTFASLGRGYAKSCRTGSCERPCPSHRPVRKRPSRRGRHCRGGAQSLRRGLTRLGRPLYSAGFVTSGFPALGCEMPLWRNWETRSTQNRVPQGVLVRFRPGAPSAFAKASAGQVLRIASETAECYAA